VNLDRAVPPNPYDFLPPRPWFTVTSNDLTDGDRLDDLFVDGKGNESPHLRWEGFPEGTRGFVVTCFDPDAPTPSGYWHWVLVDLPEDATELTRGAGGGGGPALPGAAFHIANDAGGKQYDGPAPPAGDRDHRYMFVVTAMDTDSLGAAPDASPAVINFMLAFHALGRAAITGTYSR